MTPQEILEDAAHLIQHGPLPWGKADPPGSTIPFNMTCIVKAILGNGWRLSAPKEIWPALEQVCGVRDIACWNDAPERTKEEVILALYDAKRFLP